MESQPTDIAPAPEETPANAQKAFVAADPVLAELKGISRKVGHISHKVDVWARENGIDQPEPDKNAPPSARSRMIAAMGAGLIGWKAGALLGGKAGFLTGAIRDRLAAFREISTIQSLGDLAKIVKTLYLPQATMGALVGSLVGAGAGVSLGLARGGRIKNPKEFFTHPFKSFSTLLFGEEKRKAIEETLWSELPFETPEKNQPAQAEGSWQSRMQSPPAEPAAGHQR